MLIHPLPRTWAILRPFIVSSETDCKDILSLPEFEERARRCMTPMAYEYVASGAAGEHTVRWNRDHALAGSNSAEFW